MTSLIICYVMCFFQCFFAFLRCAKYNNSMNENRSELRSHDELVIDRLERIQDKLDKIENFVQSNRIEIAKLQTKSAIFASIAGVVGGVLSSLGLDNFKH
jgi:septal ring factor EnvC (AmiA/AmiB activator)